MMATYQRIIGNIKPVKLSFINQNLHCIAQYLYRESLHDFSLKLTIQSDKAGSIN